MKKKAKITKKADPADRLATFIETINASLKKGKSPGRVDLGKNIRYLDPERLRTGKLGLDIITAGGIPRSHKTQVWGPFSTSKTTTTLGVIAHGQEHQTIKVFWAAVEGFSKPWARKNGVLIPYSDDELMELAKTKPKTAARIEREQGDWPAFVVGTHTHGDALLEMTYEAVRSNVFDLVVVDSLGAIKRYADIEERSIEDQKYGGEAGLFGTFAHKIYAAMNTKYNPETGEPYKEGVTLGWDGNKTALVCINQARQKIGGYNPSGQTRYKPVGGEALLHFWDLSIALTPGPRYSLKLKDNTKKGYAQDVYAAVDKAKVCAPGMEAEWKLYTREHEGFKPGQTDTAAEVFFWGDYFGLFERKGAFYYVEGEKHQGAEKTLEAIRNQPELQNKLYEECIAVAKRSL